MAIFKTKLEIIFASEEEVEIYYESAVKKINLLLEQYNIHNSKGNLEKVSAGQFRALLSFTGFFQATPLKSIFFDQKQQYIPSEIIREFQNIISDPPNEIKAIFYNTFLSLLTEKGWIKSLSAYFEKYYNFPADGIIILENLKDFSLGHGVYKAQFRLINNCDQTVTVFLKRSFEIQPYNELLYFYLQKKLLPTASHTEMPYILISQKSNEQLILTPLIPGYESDTILSALMYVSRKTNKDSLKMNIKKSLEILIESFIGHAALGDLLGRNDRHLMNSIIAFVVDGNPHTPPLEDLIDSEKISDYANNIVMNNIKAISLIDFDLKWLLGEKNTDWSKADIDFGLSEINLLSLLPEFNNYNLISNPFFEKRKEYISRYFNIYCHNQSFILKNRGLLFNAVKDIYSSSISEEKTKLLTQKINLFEKNNELIIELFNRYLLNFRIRLIHKKTLLTLNNNAKKYNNSDLLQSLENADLLKYLPTDSSEFSVFLQLQCFRGVLSKRDMVILSENDRPVWETIAANISLIAEKFDSRLFDELNQKIEFINKDTNELLNVLHNLNNNSASISSFNETRVARLI